jgi:hypothetical protein
MIFLTKTITSPNIYLFVQQGIDRGIISSDKEHFEKFGQKLGLTEVSQYQNL